MGWQCELFGETVRELDCSPLEAEEIEKATGYRWDAIEMVVIGERREARACRHIAAAILERRLGLSSEDALAKVDTLKVGELFKAFTEYEDDLPTVMEDGFPHSAGEPSTPG